MSGRAAVLCTCLLLAGVACPSPNSSAPKFWLRFEPSSTTVSAGDVVSIDVVVNANQAALRAWELAVASDPAVALATGALPHPQFDDDGALFVTPQLDAATGVLSRIVDLCHGGSGGQGQFRIATLSVQGQAPGVTTLRLADGVLATNAGQIFNAIASDATITVTP